MPSDALRGVRVRQERARLDLRGPVWERAPGDFAAVSLPARDGDVLRDLLLSERARSVIEIGLAYGASALAIAEALTTMADGAAHLIVDAYQSSFAEAGWTALTAAGVEDVCTLVRERSQVALPELVSSGYQADAAFVDGSHHFHNVFVDLYFLGELVRPNGLIVVDDCEYPAVGAAVAYWVVNAGWKQEEIAEGTRLRAYRLPIEPVAAPFQAFLPFWPQDRP